MSEKRPTKREINRDIKLIEQELDAPIIYGEGEEVVKKTRKPRAKALDVSRREVIRGEILSSEDEKIEDKELKVPVPETPQIVENVPQDEPVLQDTVAKPEQKSLVTPDLENGLRSIGFTDEQVSLVEEFSKNVESKEELRSLIKTVTILPVLKKENQKKALRQNLADKQYNIEDDPDRWDPKINALLEALPAQPQADIETKKEEVIKTESSTPSVAETVLPNEVEDVKIKNPEIGRSPVLEAQLRNIGFTEEQIAIVYNDLVVPRTKEQLFNLIKLVSILPTLKTPEERAIFDSNVNDLTYVGDSETPELDAKIDSLIDTLPTQAPKPLEIVKDDRPVEQEPIGSTTPEVAPVTAELDSLRLSAQNLIRPAAKEPTETSVTSEVISPEVGKEYNRKGGQSLRVEARSPEAVETSGNPATLTTTPDAPTASVENIKTPAWYSKFPNWVKNQKEKINQEALTRVGERGVNAVRKTGEWYKKQNPWIKVGVGGALIGLGLGGGAIGGSLGGTIFAIGFAGKVVQRVLAASGAFVLAESVSRGLSKDKQLDKAFLKDKHTRRGLYAAALTIAMPSIFSYTGAGAIMGQKLSLAGGWITTQGASVIKAMGEAAMAEHLGAIGGGIAPTPAGPTISLTPPPPIAMPGSAISTVNLPDVSAGAAALASANEFQPIMQEGDPFKGAIQPPVTPTPSIAMFQALQEAKVARGSNLWNTLAGTLPDLTDAERQNAVGNIIKWLQEHPTAHEKIPILTQVTAGTPLSSLQIPPAVLQNIYEHAKNPQVKLGSLSLVSETPPKISLKETLEQVAKRAATTVGAPTEVMTSPSDATTLAAMVGSPSEMPVDLTDKATVEQLARGSALTVGAPTEVMTSPSDATTLAALVGSPSEIPLNISSESVADYAKNKLGNGEGGFFSKLFGSKLVSNIDWSKVSKLPASELLDGTPNKLLTPTQLASLKTDLLSVHNKVIDLDLPHKTVEEVIKVGLEKKILASSV